MIMITNTGDIHFAQLLARRGAVRLECCGMTRRGRSATQICREAYGIRERRKDAVLARLNQIVFVMKMIRFAMAIARG